MGHCFHQEVDEALASRCCVAVVFIVLPALCCGGDVGNNSQDANETRWKITEEGRRNKLAPVRASRL